jgi:two-component system CheB/CheR fusion protein
MPGDKQKQSAGKRSKGEKTIDTNKEKDIFPIVGIGSSAGGLEALEKFFAKMPPAPNIAFVVIQHLSPKHKSIMGTLLAKYTSMKIMEIENNMKVEPNCVYLTPPNRDVTIIKGILHLKEPLKMHGINLPIDIFFRSLSEDLKERAICIILSGTATDGTLGIKAVKGGGGIAMVQSPESAKYDGMPRCAISTGLVDFILPVEQIPGQLLSYIRHPYLEADKMPPGIEPHFKNYMQDVFALIESATGHDFSHYKQNTIRRRIERRMAVHQLEKVSEYVAYLRANRGEIDALYKDLLISVTNFFRDPDAFSAIKKQVSSYLLQTRAADAVFRVWVAGCATGEEAYSIAMLFSELMEEENRFFNVQVFASDIDAAAIDYARLGLYPASIAADVSRERLSKFFLKENSSYKVKKQIREMVVFAIHNLIKDPPFSRIDMMCCRNLMIYMDAFLQKRLLSTFHYALNPRGILFLGTSESVGGYNRIFPTLDGKWKVYGHKQAVLDQDMIYSDAAFPGLYRRGHKEEEPKTSDVINIHHLAERIILETYAPPGVLINDKNQVIQFIGETDKYLANPTGKASFNILKMAREGLRYKLTTAIHNAGRQGRAIQCKGVRFEYNNEERTVDLMVRPLGDKTIPRGYMLVLFYDKPGTKLPTAVKKNEKARDSETEPYVASLEQELQSTKEYLQTTIEELETSNEELKSTNEELQSVNEEMQSTNEELETSKEELQSTNEELVTVNTELQSKVEELSRANNDINNLLANTEIDTIFLDANLCIKRFTPITIRVFNLLETDIGRPISDITSKIDFENFQQITEKVLATLEKTELEVKSIDGAWYNMRLAPYRTRENVIEGVVITFLDISKIKKAEVELRKNENRLRNAQFMANIGNWDWDLTNDFLTWSDGMYSIFGLEKKTYTPDLNSFFRYLHPDDRDQIAPGIFTREKIKKSYNLEYRIINQQTHETVHINLRGKTVYGADDTPLRIAGIVQDIGRRRKAEEALRESEEKQRLINEKPGEFAVILDLESNILFSSREFGDMTAERLIGKPFYNYLPEESRSVAQACIKRVIKTGSPDGYKVYYQTAGSGVQPVKAQVRAIKSAGLVIGLAVTGGG